MGVYIPNMEKPKRCVGCPIDERWCKLWKDFDSWDVETHPDCPLIEIDEPNGILAHDIRKYIAFIDPHMIIATTYDEQIERAKAVKDWLLSIVGERRTDDSNT